MRTAKAAKDMRQEVRLELVKPFHGVTGKYRHAEMTMIARDDAAAGETITLSVAVMGTKNNCA
jgi:hypothetical protein